MNRRPVAYTRLACDVILLLVFVIAAVEARDFQERARWFPMFVAVLGAVLVAGQLVRDAVVYRRGGDLMGGGIEYGPPKQVAERSDAADLEAATEPATVVTDAPPDTDEEAPAEDGRTAWYSWASVLVLIALIALVGTTVGVAVWLAAVLYFVARTRLWFVLVTTAVTIVLLVFLSDYISLVLPPSLIHGWPLP